MYWLLRSGLSALRDFRVVPALLWLFLLCAPIGALAQSGAGATDGSGSVAQSVPDVPTGAMLDEHSEAVEALLEQPGLNIKLLQDMRSELVGLRNRATELQSSGQTTIRELEARLEALGPAPEEGTGEPSQIASRRETLNRQLGEARVPVVQAQEAEERLGQLIVSLDRKLIEEFSQNLVTRGPAPVLPSHWKVAFVEVRDLLQAQIQAAKQAASDAAVRTAVADQLPIRIIVLLGAVALTFHLRSRAGDWIERTLDRATRRRTVAWILALRNLNRIILPTVGAGLLFAALQPGAWIAVEPQVSYFGVPPPVWYLIGAGWLGGSLFAPRTANHRVLPLDNVEARSGARIILYLGLLLACDRVLAELVAAGGLSASTQAVLYLPLILVGSVQLLLLASLLRLLRRRISDRVASGHTDAQTVNVGLQTMDFFASLIRLAAFAAPVLAMIGFLAAARLLEFPLMKTAGLAGAGLVVFDLLSKTFVSIFSDRTRRGPDQGQGDGGLIPVFVAILVFVACLPVLGLIWGARPTDIVESWRILSEGTSFGGVTLSPVGFFKFLLVFAIIIGVVRFIQTILRGTVLPRTKLDAGGRNAIIAGMNYVGVGTALVLGISAAGLDLTNLAIVAGALSVGIGFGLQTVVSNFVSGIILLIERPIKEGDWIEVGEFTGYVTGIRVRSTIIETFDKASVIVPNADLVAGTVLNRTLSDIAGRLIVPLHVSYDTDPRKVEEILMELVERHPLVLEDPAPAALFMGYGPDGLNFELRCYLRDVNFILTVKSDMYFDIFDRFRKEGIHIPLPQRDLHLRTAEGLQGLLASDTSKGKPSAESADPEHPEA